MHLEQEAKKNEKLKSSINFYELICENNKQFKTTACYKLLIFKKPFCL